MYMFKDLSSLGYNQLTKDIFTTVLMKRGDRFLSILEQDKIPSNDNFVSHQNDSEDDDQFTDTVSSLPSIMETESSQHSES